MQNWDLVVSCSATKPFSFSVSSAVSAGSKISWNLQEDDINDSQKDFDFIVLKSWSGQLFVKIMMDK